MVILFWVCAGLILWVYAGYPLLLWLLNRMRAPRVVQTQAITPKVTLIVSAYNEAEVIRTKIENSLALDYPGALLEVLVISDCSSDDTDNVVRAYEGRGVRLLRMNERGGKTLGLNAGVPAAQGEIIIFSDANAMYHPQTVRKIVRNFADPHVGCVTGESRYNLDGATDSTESENMYWRYELALKQMESRLGSLVGGDGAIYAIRKALYRPLQAADLSDFVNPMQISLQGYRNVYEPEAISFENGAATFDQEFRRKVRIVARAWRGLLRVRAVLNPFRFGFFTLQVLSHKLLRWLIPVFLLGAWCANLFLLHSPFYLCAGLVQTLFYVLAGIGLLQSQRKEIARVFYVPYYFCFVNYASLLGILSYYRGQSFTTWQTVREASN
ncbi:glycosyltransferase family 2 protein [candidate division KSB1 bacterium]|nr:glycosyltransferase family 2 protein [candidate division KSB1 bacterium]